MLPQLSTSLVGRETELADARCLLAASRLLTLTGPGGVGKTRLAIELAVRVAQDFVDGVVFVPLAAVRDLGLVAVEIAGALGLQDSRGTPIVDHLALNLEGRELLLLIDNMEQVLDAGQLVADLLAATDGLRILVTSRAPLHVTWEQEMPVPPLAEAVQLFAARAAATLPGFALTDGNAEAIGGIAERLDGLPLAIELAAARVRVLPPEAILERLDDSLALLVSENRDSPARQRTLRATIAWSFDLLGETAQRLFAICSVFRGGIDITVLEKVWAGAGIDGLMLDAVTELVNHSLLRRADEETARFTMLETVREFAIDQLMTGPDRTAALDGHAGAFWQMVENLARPPATPNRAGLDLLELEHDNLRAALDHFSSTDPDRALEMAVRLTGFWSIRGHFSEGRSRLSTLRDSSQDPDQFDALICEAWLAIDQGDRQTALPLVDEALDLARAAGDTVREAEALLCRGRGRLVIGDPTGGGDDVERSLELWEASGDRAGLTGALWLGGANAQLVGDLERASGRLERCAMLAEEVGHPVTGARARYLLGAVLMDQGDLSGAEKELAVALPAIAELGDRFGTPIALSILAGFAAQRRRPRSALRLAGAASAHELADQTNRPQFVRVLLDRWLAPVFDELGSAGGRLQAEGRGMPMDELIAAGLDPKPEDQWQVGTAPALTKREREIAVFVANGLTNRQIAERLVLSVRTVETHVGRVLTKLGFSNRSQLTAWAHHEGLMADVRGKGP